MLTFTTSDAIHPSRHPSDDALTLARLEARLPPLLSIIAGMVDLTGFFTLGNIFTAHVTGNLVVAAAAAVRGGPAEPRNRPGNPGLHAPAGGRLVPRLGLWADRTWSGTAPSFRSIRT